MTKLLYFRKPSVLTCKAKVTSASWSGEPRKLILRLNQTVFYPQGGGQPGDQGLVKIDGKSYKVEKAVFADKDKIEVDHFCLDDNDLPVIGAEAEVEVNADQRSLHTRLHSAGHILDLCVEEAGIVAVPTKGNHFPGMCSVSYQGTLEGDKSELKAKIQNLCNKYTDKSLQVDIEFENNNEEDDRCNRMVSFGGKSKCPCAGTHVSQTTEIGKINIKKIDSKKGEIKVSYSID